MVAFPEMSCVSPTSVVFLGVIADAIFEAKKDCNKYFKTLSKMAIRSQNKGWDHYNKKLGYYIGY